MSGLDPSKSVGSLSLWLASAALTAALCGYLFVEMYFASGECRCQINYWHFFLTTSPFTKLFLVAQSLFLLSYILLRDRRTSLAGTRSSWLDRSSIAICATLVLGLCAVVPVAWSIFVVTTNPIYGPKSLSDATLLLLYGELCQVCAIALSAGALVAGIRFRTENVHTAAR